MRIYLIFVLLCMSTLIYSQSNKKEQAIISSINKHNEYYTEFLKKLVNTNSGTMNFEGVKKVGTMLKKEFEALGMETQLTDGSAYKRAGHLIAQTKGNKGPKLLLIGHLDTVFEPDSPFQSYKMLNDSIMQGPGVADMKGGDVIILLALKGLKDAGVLDKMQVKVVMTGDEEKSGKPLELSKKDLIDAAKWADIALAFENADGDPKTIVTSRRGSAGWLLTVKGNAAHSSQIFSEKVGVGAIYEASRILNDFYQQLRSEENLTFNPGVIIGGTSSEYNAGPSGGTAYGKSNVVAQEVTVNGDIRAVSLEQLKIVKNVMQQIIKENYPGTSAELIFDPGGYPPLAATDGNATLLKYYNKVSEDLGYGPVTAVDPLNAGAADVSFTSGYVDMAIDGMGLSGADDHTINETGDLSMISVQAKRAAILMYRLMEGKGL